LNHAPYTAVIPAPPGRLGLLIEENRITKLSWLAPEYPLISPATRKCREVAAALIDYFHDASNLPRLALGLTGTDFQIRVWAALQQIPVGASQSYGQLAGKLGTSSRAIGQACRTNPVAILVPCHRVVSVQGIGGYMGRAKQLQIKAWLLKHEGSCAI